MIGIVGGIGPHAGLDLTRKIFTQTQARGDAEHLNVALLSKPSGIADRTEFLLGQSKQNPADGIFQVLQELEGLGVKVAGIPANTAHVPEIFGEVRKRLEAAGSSLRLLHMLEEVMIYMKEHHTQCQRIGVLCTMATYRSGLYPAILEEHGFTPVMLAEESHHELVHEAIFDREYGVKAFSSPVTKQARNQLLSALAKLMRRGADAVILGGTEIPLAIPEGLMDGVPLIDPTLILARALIREFAPGKLAPLKQAEESF